MNDLHFAAAIGSTVRTIAVLSRGVIGVDDTTPDGWTPLMYASENDNSRVVKILLSKGANMAMVDGDGYTALHYTAQAGHPAITKVLVKAGADLEATTSEGRTPLHVAALNGHSKVMEVLIEGGADPNSRASDGSTSLYNAAQEGHLDATKVLLRAKVDPLLAYSGPSGICCLPLGVAAFQGHSEIVAELIEEYGIKGYNGASGCVSALKLAAHNQHLDIMGMLASAGMVDTGGALQSAAAGGLESSVKFLLQQWKQNANGGDGAEYLNTPDRCGRTALVFSIEASRPCSPRITRLLVDAGADTATPVQLTDTEGMVHELGTPLALVDYYVSSKIIRGEDVTESQLDSLEGTRRLLMRVDAVHAVSWLWARDTSSITHAGAGVGAAVKDTGRDTKGTSTPLVTMLPVLRRRAGRPRVLLAALFRNSMKP